MNCPAHGCPLEGTISSSNGEGATYYCRFHYGKTAKENDEITARVRRNLELILAAETLKDGHFVFDDLKAGKAVNLGNMTVDERGFPSFHYHRVMSTLLKEIKGGVS
jgi:hypothetical protein